MKNKGQEHPAMTLRSARAHMFSLAAIAAIVALTAIFLFAYNHEQDDVNGAVATKWCNGNQNNGSPCTFSVSWSLGPQPGSNVDQTGGGYVQALQAAFNSWQQASLNSQPVANILISQGPSSPQNTPNVDCQNVIGFTDSTKSDFPTGTIAFTSIATSFGCTVAGANCPAGSPPNTYSCPGSLNPNATYTCPLPSCIVDTDIEFNPQDHFSTASPTPASDFDLQGIATHEIGHMLGMDHSGLGNAIMFAFGDTGGVPNRNLSTDDILGIGSIYPSASFASSTGSLAGTVTQGASGIFASHVLVIDTTSGNAVADGLTDTNGNYSIDVPPGQYNVVALPLAGIYDITNYGGWACGYGENSPPCCDPTLDPTLCNGTQLSPPTNYTGKFK
ncbi:MAG TPA: matrixin family metalloprotease [Terriglobia bacterium]|nr:matrixin family metalloprotease [Terriglobia bacterium]